MVGYTSCLTAGIVRAVLLRPDAPDVEEGTRKGLAASRALHLRGYGNAVEGSDRAELGFPVAEMAAIEPVRAFMDSLGPSAPMTPAPVHPAICALGASF